MSILTWLGGWLGSRERVLRQQIDGMFVAKSAVGTAAAADIEDFASAVHGHVIADVTGLSAALAAKARPADIAAAVVELRDGVPAGGDTLGKLHGMLIGIGGQWDAADLATRDTLAVQPGDRVFVADDGDGRWVIYRATSAGPSASFVPLTDADGFAAAMSTALAAVIAGAVGRIHAFAGAVPEGWLPCDGAAVSRIVHADLFAVIGTTFGVGDGETTFNLPRIPVRRIPAPTGSETIAVQVPHPQPLLDGNGDPVLSPEGQPMFEIVYEAVQVGIVAVTTAIKATAGLL